MGFDHNKKKQVLFYNHFIALKLWLQSVPNERHQKQASSTVVPPTVGSTHNKSQHKTTFLKSMW